FKAADWPNTMRSSKTPGSARRVRVPSKLRTTTVAEVGIVLRTEIGMRFLLNAAPFQQSLIVCRRLSARASHYLPAPNGKLSYRDSPAHGSPGLALLEPRP